MAGKPRIMRDIKDPMVRLGRLIAEALAARGMTQAALAERIDQFPTVIAQVVAGVKRVPAGSIPILAAALGLDPWLIELTYGELPRELAEVDPAEIVRRLREETYNTEEIRRLAGPLSPLARKRTRPRSSQ